MNIGLRLTHEFKALGLATAFFGSWLTVLVLLKQLLLADYQIVFHGFSMALVGTLVLAKVVLVLEHVSLGAWIKARPVWVDLLLRTGLYALGVFVALVLEKGFESRHEHGGFAPALKVVFQHADMSHVWVNSICLAGALLAYNLLAVLRRHLGQGGLPRLLLSPLPGQPKATKPQTSVRDP